jgi:hypothetical protein
LCLMLIARSCFGKIKKIIWTSYQFVYKRSEVRIEDTDVGIIAREMQSTQGRLDVFKASLATFCRQ